MEAEIQYKAQSTLKNFWVTFKTVAFILGVVWMGRIAHDWWFDIERPMLTSEAYHAMLRKGVLEPVFK